MEKQAHNSYVLWGIALLFMTIVAIPVWSQDTSQDTQTSEEVQAATNPAGQVPDEIPDDPASVAQGRSLFGQHCTACHALGKQIIGPALASVHNRHPIDWLVEFIQNSQHVINQDSSEYARQLYEQYNNQVMPNFEFLSREDILDIMAYIKVESVSTTSGVSGYMSEETESVQEQAGAEDEAYAQKEESESQGGNLGMVIGGLVIGILLVVIIVIAFRRRSKQEA